MIGDILQPTHLLFVLVVALLVLGPKRLPEVGRALGRGLRDFRNALNTDELHDQMISTTSSPAEAPKSEASDEAVAPPTAQADPASSDPAASSSEPEPAVSAPAHDPTP